MKLICDSGSTKSAWCLTDGTTPLHYSTQGINPFQQTEEEIAAILHMELATQLPDNINIKEVYFYGAGCTKEKSPIVAKAIRATIAPDAKITVDSDLLGAAIALCGDEEGIVCILGTGSNAAFYDGKALHSCIPALGYILGDEGSGAYIGKRLIGDILKHRFSERIRNMFFGEMHETQASIIQKTYREPLANRYLASISPFCARHREEEEIHEFLIDCFSQFFERNIVPMTNELNLENCTVNCVGSIAYFYRNEIREVAKKYGFCLGTILRAPIDGLIRTISSRPNQ